MSSPAPNRSSISWGAFGLFYVVILVVTAVLDQVNGVLTLAHLWPQLVLITTGVLIFALVGWRAPRFTPAMGVLLTFTVGILTIVPGVLLSLGQRSDFWAGYFLVAGGMAGGSSLGLLFIWLSARIRNRHRSPSESQGE